MIKKKIAHVELELLDVDRRIQVVLHHALRQEDLVLEVVHVPGFFFSSRRRHTRFDCDWSSDVCSSDLKAGPRNLLRWQLTHAGPMATNVAESGGFSRTDPALPAPDIQWHALPAPYQNFGLADPSIRAMSLLITLVAVGSRGRIRLRSADPRHKPAIDPA